MSTNKRRKLNEVVGSSIKYDDKNQSYKVGSKFVNFGIGDRRVYDVGDFFLDESVVFRVLSENNYSITVGDPQYKGDALLGENMDLIWTLSRVDHKFSGNCTPENIKNILDKCSKACDIQCLRGIPYTNKFGDTCLIHVNGKELQEICRTLHQEADQLCVRAADLLNENYRGHRSNGDSVIPVSSIRAGDMAAFKVLFREKILRTQTVGSTKFLITSEVLEAEDSLIADLGNLLKDYYEPKIEIEIDPEAEEKLVPEQVTACHKAMNNGVSYICGIPGSGKTSALCKIIELSEGTVVLTPSHVAREVVDRRAHKNGIPRSSYSVEVLAFGVRHIHEWHPEHDPGEVPISERSENMMKKFQDEDGNLQVSTLIVEEASMADIFQVSKVVAEFCKFDSFKRVIFCGDHRQLPSVSKGRILQDVMECTKIPGTILEENHRSGSALSRNLKHVLKSSLVSIEEDETFEIQEYGLDDCLVDLDKYDRRRIIVQDPVIRLYLDAIEDSKKAHVFAYTNLEVTKLNAGIKLALFGESSIVFPPGCKVRVRDNEAIQPPIFYKNDFLEIVKAISPKEYVVRRWEYDSEDPKEIKITGRLKDALTLGFVSTIHSFQGNETDVIICHTVPNSGFFNRDGLYTSVSRARSKAYVVGVNDFKANWKKVLYKKSIDRKSNLGKRL